MILLNDVFIVLFSSKIICIDYRMNENVEKIVYIIEEICVKYKMWCIFYEFIDIMFDI